MIIEFNSVGYILNTDLNRRIFQPACTQAIRRCLIIIIIIIIFFFL